MIILTAGHTGAHTGAQCAETHFDEGAENIWLRNRIAEILTNKYGLVVLVDDDRASLKLLTQALSDDLALSDNILHTETTDNTEDAVASPASKSVEIQRALLTKSNSESLNPNGKKSFQSVKSVGDINSVNQRSLSPWRENSVRDKKNSVRDKENAEASPASKSVESVERFSRSERANKSSPPELGGVPEGGEGLLSVSSVNQRS